MRDMATDDSYEIMPYKEIVDLKKQISELKSAVGDTSSKELLNSMANLTKTMDSMMQLFSAAAEEMKLEEKSESELSQKLGPLFEKVEKLEEQNKTIAEGLVAIADMVKEVKEKERRIEKPRQEYRPRPKEPEMPSFNESFPPLGQSVTSPFPSEFNELPPLEPPAPMMQPRGPMGGQRNPFPPPMPRGPMPRQMGPMPPFEPLPPLPPLEEEPKKGKFFGLFKK